MAVMNRGRQPGAIAGGCQRLCRSKAGPAACRLLAPLHSYQAILQLPHAKAIAESQRLHCSCRSPARIALAAVLSARHRAGAEHAAQNLVGAVGGLAL